MPAAQTDGERVTRYLAAIYAAGKTERRAIIENALCLRRLASREWQKGRKKVVASYPQSPCLGGCEEPAPAVWRG